MLIRAKKRMSEGLKIDHDLYKAKVRESGPIIPPCVPLGDSRITPRSRAWSSISGHWQWATRGISFLHNNFYLSFNLFCCIFSTLWLPSAVPDRDACGLFGTTSKGAKSGFLVLHRTQMNTKSKAISLSQRTGIF